MNTEDVSFDGDGDTTLMWVLRDHFNLTGTKYGCGIAQCGAYTVHVDGKAQRSCVTPVSALGGKSVTTIEIAAFPSRFEAHILPHDNTPTGVGEIGIPPAAPALTNAIFAATGKRIRKLPILDQLKA